MAWTNCLFKEERQKLISCFARLTGRAASRSIRVIIFSRNHHDIEQGLTDFVHLTIRASVTDPGKYVLAQLPRLSVDDQDLREEIFTILTRGADGM